MRFRLVIPLLLPLLACMNANVVPVWSDPENPPQPLTRLLVVVLVEKEDVRAVWEEALVDLMERNQVDATASFRMLPILPDSVDVLDLSADAGCDGVLVISQYHREKKTIEEPGYYADRTFSYYIIDNSLPNDSTWVMVEETAEVYVPSHKRTESTLVCDIDVLDGEDVVWRGVVEVFNPASDRKTARKVADKVVFALSRNGIVPSGL